VKTKSTILRKQYPYQEIRIAIQHNRQITENFLKHSDHFYRVNRRDARCYLRVLPKWSRLIDRHFQELRAAGIQPVYADVCGRADGAWLRAEYTYTFTLEPISPFHLPNPKKIDVAGDVFNARNFYMFLNTVRNNQHQLDFVTFEPIVGLHNYTPSEEQNPKPRLHPEVTHRRLANNLKKLLEIVRPGGYVFINKPFQFGEYSGLLEFLSGLPQEEWKLSLWLKEFCKNNKCTLKQEDFLGGPLHLIRKRLPRTR
jgi:hypothetical protein